MGVIEQTLCDGCGELIYGKKGIAFVKKDYIQIIGQVTFHKVTQETQWVDHMHLTPTDHENLSFCMDNKGLKLDCLIAYIESRTLIVKNKIEISKRKRATEEQQDDYTPRFNRG